MKEKCYGLKVGYFVEIVRGECGLEDLLNNLTR